MNRCLHITIHDNAGALSRGATAPFPGRGSTDPGSSNVIAPVDDPGSSSVIAPVDDPGGTPLPSEGPGIFGTVAAATGSCCCAAPVCQGMAAPRKATPYPFIGPRDYSGFVIVRIAEGIESKKATNLWTLAQEHELAELQAVLELRFKDKAKGQIRNAPPTKPPKGTLASRPLVELHGPLVKLHEPVEHVEKMATEYVEADAAKTPLSRLDILDFIHDLERTTASTAFPPLHSLASYWRLDLREHSDLVEEVVARLNSLAEVGLAYRELAATDPQGAANGRVFSEDQGYLDDAPAGISASWARNSLTESPKTPLFRAPSKTPLTLCDLEQGWNLDHQDLVDQGGIPLVVSPLFGVNRAQDGISPGHHGTAVLGQLAAAGKGPFGVKGIVAGLCRVVVASHYDKDSNNGNVSAAITQALALPLVEGDILLIEVQRGLLPAEVDEADFNAIRLAAGRGIIVVEAAGNGGFDLDAYSDPSTGRSLRRDDSRFRDSGAILVGAARAGLPHDRAPFSNYGSRLDCFGWGESVTTCGFGDLAGTGDTNSYTNHFSGTSSAVPIIAGAAALLQSLYEAHAGVRLGPPAMRAFLSDPATGTRQGPNVAGHIGVMPDLEAIVREQLQVVPDVYLRRSIGDDGSAAGLQDEISSSPDLLVSRGGIIETSNRFGEGTLRENLPAPGDPFTPGSQDEIYIRLRNRGIGPGKVHVRLFASPAATLITSERWIPIGRLDVRAVPQGDTLVVAGPLVPAPALTCPPGTLWSFLAVLSKPGETGYPHDGDADHPGPPCLFDWAVGLPPGPPYFDWTEYRAFLRQPGVAWRNTHRVAATRSAALTFRIAGTPDRDRHFDFEVIQRLPDGATVALTVGAALAAKLRQRQPWIDGDSGPRISLPKRPRSAIRGVRLAAGAYAEAMFTVDAGDSVLTAGHSLALRQLWRGEEVGRITWFFGLHL